MPILDWHLYAAWDELNCLRQYRQLDPCVMIYSQWPASSTSAIGTSVGVSTADHTSNDVAVRKVVAKLA